MGGGHLAPDGLVIDAGLRVLLAVDVRDALAVVPGRGAAVLAALDGQQSGVLLLGALRSLESQESSLGVESAARVSAGGEALT